MSIDSAAINIKQAVRAEGFCCLCTETHHIQRQIFSCTAVEVIVSLNILDKILREGKRLVCIFIVVPGHRQLAAAPVIQLHQFVNSRVSQRLHVAFADDVAVAVQRTALGNRQNRILLQFHPAVGANDLTGIISAGISLTSVDVHGTCHHQTSVGRKCQGHINRLFYVLVLRRDILGERTGVTIFTRNHNLHASRNGISQHAILNGGISLIIISTCQQAIMLQILGHGIVRCNHHSFTGSFCRFYCLMPEEVAIIAYLKGRTSLHLSLGKIGRINSHIRQQ